MLDWIQSNIPAGWQKAQACTPVHRLPQSQGTGRLYQQLLPTGYSLLSGDHDGQHKV